MRTKIMDFAIALTVFFIVTNLVAKTDNCFDYTKHFLKNYPDKYEQIKPLIEHVKTRAHEANINPIVPTILISLESGWNISATGGIGERGLMQVLPKGVCGRGQNLSTPEGQINAGINCLVLSRDQCGDNLTRILTMYASGRCVSESKKTQRKIRHRVALINKWSSKCNSMPYQGGKGKIAKDLLLKMGSLTPSATNFIDLFGGGGSMSFTAQDMGYQVFYNEIQSGLAKLVGYMDNPTQAGSIGIFPDYSYNFASREDFENARKKDDLHSEFIKILYSFGNNRRDYFCNRDREPFKKHGHNLVMFRDVESLKYIEDYFKDSCNHVLEYILTGKTWRDRKKIFVNIILKTEAVRVAGIKKHFGNVSGAEFHKLTNKGVLDAIKLKCPDIKFKKYRNSSGQLRQLEQLEHLGILQQLDGLARLDRLQQTGRLFENKKILVSSLDYKDIELLDKSIIYCDPPYVNTKIYVGQKFNHEDFYNWLRNSKHQIFISEYTMPDDFKAIFEIEKQSNMGGGKHKKTVTEKLYTNKWNER